MLGPFVDNLKAKFTELADGAKGEKGKDIYQATKDLIKDFGDSGRAWEYSGGDWYKVFPYSFLVEITKGGKVSRYKYTLPIPPQQMTTKMMPASAATPTLGGVVEETSDNVFWVIQMVGTTGTAISRNLADVNQTRDKVAKQFRKKLETTGLLSGVAAQVNALASKVGGTYDAYQAGDVEGVIGALNNAILPPMPYSESAVDEKVNGFTEMQELHRFLYTFSHLKAHDPKNVTLKFQNYKTGQQWRIVMQDFTIQQNAANPHLYRYSIQLKAWDVKAVNADEKNKAEYDRFGKEGDLKEVNTVGADGLYNAFKAFSGSIKGESNNTIASGFLKPYGG